MTHYFKLPDVSQPMSDAEAAWLSLLRDLYCGDVPSPGLAAVQALRFAIWNRSG